MVSKNHPVGDIPVRNIKVQLVYRVLNNVKSKFIF